MSFFVLLIFFFFACTSNAITARQNNICRGDTKAPHQFVSYFRSAVNSDRVKNALGKTNEGKLCQGQAYLVMKNLTIYRLWNSTNPSSEKGNWWIFNKPQGEIAKYRKDYEICYQWSPLDKLVSCTLKAGTKVIIGTGQSAKCSPFLTYPSSPLKEIYIDNPSSSILNKCKVNKEVFAWK